ncbi:hypothetical protein [Aquimarina agarivorans]|uniref:hypothetical protein n=1 Tax=Aquimarina agarivorans TaxID=980584 RepID=UPI000248E86B|nr:hypothetical protein [Aquimarina agarivorans]
MELLKNKPLREVAKSLLKIGYDARFMLEKNMLFNPSSNKKYSDTDCILMAYNTYDKKECPNNVDCILYLIKCIDGTKGSLLFSKKKHSNTQHENFMQQLLMDFKA